MNKTTSPKIRLIEKICGIRPFKRDKTKDFRGKILIVNGAGSISNADMFAKRIREIFPDSKITIFVNPKNFDKSHLNLNNYFDDIIVEGERRGIINKVKDKISKMFFIRRYKYDAIIILYDKFLKKINKDLLALFAGAHLKIGYIKQEDGLFLLTNRFLIYKSVKAFAFFFLVNLGVFILAFPVMLLWFILIFFMGLACLNLNNVRKEGEGETIFEPTNMNKKGLVSINIVNWNGKRYLEQCIESILKQTYKPIEINIIDNFSTDGSMEYIRNKYPEIRIVENKKNQGFSKAHNQGILLSKGEYIIPLNFDIVLSADFVEKMVEAVNMSKEIGMVSGKLYKKNEYGLSQVIDTTGIVMHTMFPCDRGENNLDEGGYGKYEYIFGASGAAPLYRKEMLEDIKIGDEYFDEDFFIYVEDVDLSWRAQLYGWKCIYTPYAIAYHERGATRISDEQIKKSYYTIGYRNRYLAILKNSLILNIFQHLGYIILLEAYFFMSHLSKGHYYMLKVPIDAVRLFSKMLRKRRIIQRYNKVKSKYMENFLFKSHMI